MELAHTCSIWMEVILIISTVMFLLLWFRNATIDTARGPKKIGLVFCHRTLWPPPLHRIRSDFSLFCTLPYVIYCNASINLAPTPLSQNVSQSETLLDFWLPLEWTLPLGGMILTSGWGYDLGLKGRISFFHTRFMFLPESLPGYCIFRALQALELPQNMSLNIKTNLGKSFYVDWLPELLSDR